MKALALLIAAILLIVILTGPSEIRFLAGTFVMEARPMKTRSLFSGASW